MEQNDTPLFVIEDDPVVEWPVTVSLPADGGRFADYRFTVQMRVLSPSEYEALFKEPPETAVATTAGSGIGSLPSALEGAPRKLSEVVTLNVPIFRRLITGWNSVNDRAGSPIAFTPDRLAQEISGPRGPALSVGLWRAINEVRYGRRLPDGTQQDGAAQGN